MHAMEHDGHRERLRNRCRREGLEGFSPHEVLELLLTYAIPRVNTNPIAHRLINHFGSFHAVLEAAPEELEKVPGMGPQSSLLISMLLPILRAYEQERLLPRLRLNTYPELAAYCRTLFLGALNEQIYVLCFDARLRLLATELIASGTPDEVTVIPRQIVSALMRHNAVGAVVTHNHPSGSPAPSQEDADMTAEIQAILQGVGVRLYDHVLIAGEQAFSFHRNGMLQETAFSSPGQGQTLAADRPQRQLPARKMR